MADSEAKVAHISKIYFPNLGGVRAFAALTVMFYHYSNFATLNGHLAVVLFFVLSGFLITTLMLEEREVTTDINVKYFFIRRALRIWPLYYLVLLINFVLILIGFDGSNSTQIPILWYSVFFLANIPYVLKISPLYTDILWSLGAEEQYYLISPFMVKYSGKYLWLFLLGLIGLFTMAPPVLDYVNYNYFGSQIKSMRFVSDLMQRTEFHCMATGALGAYVWHSKPRLIQPFFAWPVQAILFAATVLLWWKKPVFLFADLLFSIAFVLIILNFAFNKKVILNLEYKVFNYLGKLSFGMYVYHLIVGGFVTWVFTNALGFKPHWVVHALVSTVGTIAVSALSYNYFEKIFLKIKNLNFTIIKSGSNI